MSARVADVATVPDIARRGKRRACDRDDSVHKRRRVISGGSLISGSREGSYCQYTSTRNSPTSPTSPINSQSNSSNSPSNSPTTNSPAEWVLWLARRQSLCLGDWLARLCQRLLDALWPCAAYNAFPRTRDWPTFARDLLRRTATPPATLLAALVFLHRFRCGVGAVVPAIEKTTYVPLYWRWSHSGNSGSSGSSSGSSGSSGHPSNTHP